MQRRVCPVPPLMSLEDCSLHVPGEILKMPVMTIPALPLFPELSSKQLRCLNLYVVKNVSHLARPSYPCLQWHDAADSDTPKPRPQ